MDLDGTAVSDDYSLSKASEDAFALARRCGHVTAFVSGRRDVDMLSLKDAQWCADYHILNNGGKIIRCRDRKIIMNDCIGRETAVQMIRFASANDLQLHIVSGMTWRVTKMTEGTLQYARQLGVIPEVIHSPEDTDCGRIEGFMATADLEPVAAYIDKEMPDLMYVHSEPGTIDIMKKGVSKWNGIAALAELLGIERKDIITAGNYYNDIEMIEKAGTGIAVANAVDRVKEAADYVTEHDNNHDAAAEIIDLMLKGVFDSE